MLVYYFVPFIVSNCYLLFWVSNGHNSVTVQNRTHVYMNSFDHKGLGNHLLQLCPKVVKHPVLQKIKDWVVGHLIFKYMVLAEFKYVVRYSFVVQWCIVLLYIVLTWLHCSQLSVVIPVICRKMCSLQWDTLHIFVASLNSWQLGLDRFICLICVGLWIV